MKYFVNLLPVTDNMKPGDILRCEMTSGHPIGPNKAVRLRRLLCSRNIQVGDKFTSVAEKFREDTCVELRPVPNSQQVIVVGEWQEVVKFQHEQFPNYQPFKVIGEISPAATWVKEGDKLEEDQVEIDYKVTFKKEAVIDGTNVIAWRHPRVHGLYWKWYENMHYFPDKCTSEFIVGHQNHHEDLCEVPRNICVDITTVKIKCPTCGTFH